MELPHNWQILTCCILILAVAIVIWRRKHFLTVLLAASIIVAGFASIMIPISWKTNRVVRLYWTNFLSNKDGRQRNIYLSFNRGGMNLCTTEIWTWRGTKLVQYSRTTRFVFQLIGIIMD